MAMKMTPERKKLEGEGFLDLPLQLTYDLAGGKKLISTNHHNLILASRSPRRRDLLKQAGVLFEVWAADIDERVMPGERPEDYTMRTALMKAQAVSQIAQPNRYVLAADTTVALEDKILGKPKDKAHAVHMLRLLSGRIHRVLTAVVLMKAPNCGVSRFLAQTKVRFRKLSDEIIQSYVQTNEPMDKAGAYAVQGRGVILVEWIEGSYTNVVGLPLVETTRMLERAGIWRPFEKPNHTGNVARIGAGGVR